MAADLRKMRRDFHPNGEISSKFILEKASSRGEDALRSEFWLGFFVPFYIMKPVLNDLNAKFLAETGTTVPIFDAEQTIREVSACYARKIRELGTSTAKVVPCSIPEVTSTKNLISKSWRNVEPAAAKSGTLLKFSIHEIVVALGENGPNVMGAHAFSFFGGSRLDEVRRSLERLNKTKDSQRN